MLWTFAKTATHTGRRSKTGTRRPSVVRCLGESRRNIPKNTSGDTLRATFGALATATRAASRLRRVGRCVRVGGSNTNAPSANFSAEMRPPSGRCVLAAGEPTRPVGVGATEVVLGVVGPDLRVLGEILVGVVAGVFVGIVVRIVVGIVVEIVAVETEPGRDGVVLAVVGSVVTVVVGAGAVVAASEVVAIVVVVVATVVVVAGAGVTAERPSTRNRRCSRALRGRRNTGPTGTAPPMRVGSATRVVGGTAEPAPMAVPGTIRLDATVSANGKTARGLIEGHRSCPSPTPSRWRGRIA